VFKTSNYPRDEKDFLVLENNMATRSMKAKKDLFEKQHGRCFWCGKEMAFVERKEGDKTPFPPNMVTQDHVFPRGTKVRHNGSLSNSPTPVVLACYECNNRRGNMRFARFANKVGVSLVRNWGDLIWKRPELCKKGE